MRTLDSYQGGEGSPREENQAEVVLVEGTSQILDILGSLQYFSLVSHSNRSNSIQLW